MCELFDDEINVRIHPTKQIQIDIKNKVRVQKILWNLASLTVQSKRVISSGYWAWATEKEYCQDALKTI